MAVVNKQTSSPGTNNLSQPPQEPTVLVVDDEPLVRNLLEVYLRSQGFRVLTASDGVEAIDVYRENRGEIRVVLLDVQMPQLTGPETLASIQKINPGVVACFMSGNPGRYSTADLTELGARRLFDKPMVLAELGEFLWQLVGASTSQ